MNYWVGVGRARRHRWFFVTHDLEEAVALADKVVALTASPATVKKKSLTRLICRARA